MTDQVLPVRPAFVTQRDGSPLASSNCRMASIACGLQLESGQTSTGAKMRSFTSDQSGGTDSGDAREAWADGYGQSLIVRDGETFDRALDDLRSWRAVHLDVWHATVGGPCLSGSGSYGHTMIVLPDHNASGWLVGDPWCTDGYHRVTESKLRAGAERWGSEVFGRAAEEPDYPTGGRPTDPRVLAIVRRIVKRLMSEAYPGGPPGELRYPPDTGGGSILFTVTHARAPEVAVGPFFSPSTSIGVATVASDNANLIACADGEYHPVARGYVRNVAALVKMTDGKYAGDDAYLVSIGGGESGLLLAALATFLPSDPDAPGDEIEIRRAQWDADAEGAIGPRP